LLVAQASRDERLRERLRPILRPQTFT